MARHPLRIGITLGDPAGIGPELVLRLLERCGNGRAGVVQASRLPERNCSRDGCTTGPADPPNCRDESGTHEDRKERSALPTTPPVPAFLSSRFALRNAGDLRNRVQPIIYGNAALLRRVAQASQEPWPADLQVLPPQALDTITVGVAPVLLDFPFPEAVEIEPGRTQAACGRMAATWIEAAARDALAQRVAGIVTAPIHKHALHLAGISHPGHTEMLAALTGAPCATMLFWSPDLIVSLATIHLPLAAVPTALTVERLLDTIRLTAAACARFGRAKLPIGVLALNPHAGESGLFGDEEERVIRPAIAAANAEGIPAVGPLVPDVAFREEARAAHAAYVAMYHDQGLIPFKMLAFDEGVNVTLGLPIVRTSPDHGTAFDIAWQGTADPSSLLAAFACAARLAGA